MGKIGIIIQREFNQRVRKKSFIITTILTPLLFLGIMFAPMLVMNLSTSGTKTILVSDQTGYIADNLKSSSSIEFQPTSMSLEEVKQSRAEGKYEDIYGVLVIGDQIAENPRDARLYTYSSPTTEIEMSLSSKIADIIENEKLKQYHIENLPEIMEQVRTKVNLQSFKIDDAGNDKESSSTLSFALAYVFGFLIYMFVFLYGAMVMQGVIEEKSSKVLEIMVSSVKPFELMMGKILGIASVAVTQFVIWVVFLLLAGSAAIHFMSPDMAASAAAMADGSMDMGAFSGLDPTSISAINNLSNPMFLIPLFGGFLIYFIGGYLLYAAMFAAIGSAVDNVADSQQLQLPVTIPMILAIVVMVGVIKDPHSPLAFWFSMIPFTSPIIMLARLPYGVPGWELALSIALLYGSFIVMVWLAGKIYRVGIFMYGKKPTFKELLKWIRYKY